ncbi:SURF1 family cytochrome oxidase biogenesis protein [Aeromicrobium massiliense]|uniref:SURF1 family cytochrome oxidase biogenesis protein n=1 Tax=Aeromicrobium massiliense TaxID=1464554 RepID=UPI000673F7B1|nr:SURF1 family protein [Aeromicrobium massiliense]
MVRTLLRWTFAVVVVAFLAWACWALGQWQWDKHDRIDADSARIQRYLDEPPVPLDSLVRPGDAVAKDEEWRPVTVSGTYDTSQQVTVRFTTRDKQPGVDVVTPLVTDDGTAVLVNRGWVQVPNNDVESIDIPDPPAGEVTITAWLRPDTGADGSAIAVQDDQVRAISSEVLADHTGYTLYPGFVELQEEDPAPAESLAHEPAPEESSAQNFFYAWQWWFFGVLGLVGAVYFGRQSVLELRQRRAARADEASAAGTDERQASETSSA